VVGIVDSFHDLDMQKATNRLVEDLTIELTFSDIIRGVVMSNDFEDEDEGAPTGSPLLWILRIVAVLATVAMAVITVASFQAHVILGALSLFLLPVIVLGIVLAIEGVCKRIFRLS
jgi:type IV secretory pathway VirB2 component (pilin)